MRSLNNQAQNYIKENIDRIKKRDGAQTEFIQSVEEVLQSVALSLANHPEYMENSILERITEPERQYMFKIAWVDDQGKIRTNRGYKVPFNGVLGPFKGGLRFHPSVNLSVIKFLAFEQTFKNALTGLPIGGGKGGSDFDPKGKSEGEIKRFCEAFMTELYHFINSNVDVPAGDIGVGGREIGYLFGTYRRITGAFDNGTITGKGITYGGSAFRPEATGFGIAYFCNEILKHQKDSFKDKAVVVSGYGQVAWGTIKKVTQLGGKVITISGSDGYVEDPAGINTPEKLDYIEHIKQIPTNTLQGYAERFGAIFHAKEKPWKTKADIVIPCATQNEIGIEEAQQIVANGTRYVCEGANMPCTNEAIEFFKENGLIVGPAKAANAGGVSVSAMEMSQNSMKVVMSDEEMDRRLQGIMEKMHQDIINTCNQYHLDYDLVTGANITAFERVANTMLSLGIY